MAPGFYELNLAVPGERFVLQAPPPLLLFTLRVSLQAEPPLPPSLATAPRPPSFCGRNPPTLK